MSTVTASLARLAHRGRAICVPLLVAGALVAGCGTEHAPAAGAAAAAAGSPAGSSAHATPPQRPTPVPTVTGGTVPPGLPACAGWPAHATHAMMPANFVAVTAERCVTSIQAIAGKGQWETATLEKATKDLAPLIAALRHRAVTRTPGMLCPELAMLPPQLLLVSASGQEMIPLLPAGGCGLVQSAVLTAIAALPWHPVTVRLVAPVRNKVPEATSQQATVSAKAIRKLPGQPGALPQ